MTTETDAQALRKMSGSLGRPNDVRRDILARVASQLESDAKRFEERQKLQDIGRRCAECLAEMVAALECDYDRLAELRRERSDADELRWLGPAYDDERAELADLEKAAGDCESREDAERRISEDPLSIELSAIWTPGENPTDGRNLRALILLGTGGPATRIVCELDQHMQPDKAWIEAQDWFLPWTEYTGDAIAQSDLLTYCQQFYFGEG